MNVNAHLQNRAVTEIHSNVTRESEYLHLEKATAEQLHNYEELN